MNYLATDIFFEFSPILTLNGSHHAFLELESSFSRSGNEAVIHPGQTHNKAFICPFVI
jgi:hypothetical protein